MSAGRWDALDGLRAVAVLLVIGTHTAPFLPGGYVGVDVFFVLSGFLITTLLLREHERTGRIHVAAFYMRRALRLFPALAVTIGLAVLLALTVAPSQLTQPTLSSVGWVVVYAGDYVCALAPGHTLGMLSHTWSLAVEEQFYLLWPFVCALCLVRAPSRARAGAALMCFALLDMLWNGELARSAIGSALPDRAYFSLDGHAMGLLAGAALAMAFSAGAADRLARAPLAVSAAGWIGLGAIIAVTLELPNEGGSEPLAVAIGTTAAVVVVAALLSDPAAALSRALRSPLARWLGRRSYGLYLYHYVLLTALVPAGVFTTSVQLTKLAVVALAVLAADLSYRWIETPFLAAKERLAFVTATIPRDAPAPGPALAARADR